VTALPRPSEDEVAYLDSSWGPGEPGTHVDLVARDRYRVANDDRVFRVDAAWAFVPVGPDVGGSVLEEPEVAQQFERVRTAEPGNDDRAASEFMDL